jgi:hypothetical protein
MSQYPEPPPAAHRHPEHDDRRRREKHDDHRLIVAEDRHLPGDYVYLIVDWETGTIVDELPRKDLDDLRQSADYKAGALINRKA